jgi:hypothetical protein
MADVVDEWLDAADTGSTTPSRTNE